MVIPTLETPRLTLVPPDASCESAYLRFYTDASASALYGGPLTPDAAWSRLVHDRGCWHVQGFGVWAIRRKTDGDVIGVCGFWQGRGWPRELTWWLQPEARGAGYALEASQAVVEHAYEAWGWDVVETYAKDANEPAKALINRLGGVHVERRTFPDGVARDFYRIPRR